MVPAHIEFPTGAQVNEGDIHGNPPAVLGNIANVLAVINPLLSEALAYIAENLFTVKDISEVAGAVFVTESYLYRLFKKELLKTPKKYLIEKRLLHAQTRLKKGARPIDVASSCGFDDYTTFYRNYLEYFGKSPSMESENR